MTQEINLEEIKNKLYKKLQPSGWADVLKTFLLSSDFDNILMTLYKESQENKKFTPKLNQVLRAFELCPYNKLKVIMIGQDPYPYESVCDGLAFSCGNTGKPEASLRYIFKEIQESVYKETPYTRDPDLKRWAEQGVLLINTALTTTIGKVGTHYKLWQPFLAFLFDTLAFQNSGLVYVFLGKKAQEWAESVPDNNWKIFTTHPAYAAHTNSESWNSENMFLKVNELLKKNYNESITW